MSSLRNLSLFAIGLLASGCQSTGELQDNSPMVQELTVTQPITMAMGGGGARFQYGDRTTALNPDEPYCVIRGGARTLEPDTFIITRVEKRSTGTVQDDLPSNDGLYQEIHLWLSSPVQPAIQDMVCRRPSSLSYGDMTAADIQAIIGSRFILR